MHSVAHARSVVAWLEDQPPLHHKHTPRNSRLLTGSIWARRRIDVPGDLAQRWVGRIVARLSEVDMIEGVVCLRPDLKSQGLLLVNVLEKCHINVGKVRSGERVASIVAEDVLCSVPIEDARLLKTGIVERTAGMAEVAVQHFGGHNGTAGSTRRERR